PGLGGIYSGDPDRPATGVSRSDQQCVAALSVPALHTYRVCRGQNVDRDYSAFDDHLGAGTDSVLFAELSRRLVVVLGKYFHCQRDLYRQPRLGSFAGVTDTDDFGVGKVADSRQRRFDRAVLYSVGIRGNLKSVVRDALGPHHQPGRADSKYLGRIIWHVCATAD